MDKSLRVKVRQFHVFRWDFGIFKGKKMLMGNPIVLWRQKSAAIRNAKAMAKRIGIKFDPEIIKQHGC